MTLLYSKLAAANTEILKLSTSSSVHGMMEKIENLKRERRASEGATRRVEWMEILGSEPDFNREVLRRIEGGTDKET
jgi:hypothetical protein